MSWFPLFAFRRFLHVLAASIWVGGQFVMIGLLPTLRRKGSDLARAAGVAYNRLAWPAFAVLVATGIWNILARSFSGQAIAVISVKLVFVFLSGFGAAAHQFTAAFMKDKTPLRTAIIAAGATMSTLFAVAAMYLGLLLTSV